MAGPTVTLAFAGDSSKLEKAFDDVGAAAKESAGKVDRSSKEIGDGFDRMGSAASGTTTHARGLADTMDGLGTVIGVEALGPVAAMGMGLADLADGIGTTVIPALQQLWALMLANPLIAIIAVIGLLVAAFITAYKNSETFRNIVDGAMESVKNTFDSLWPAIKGVLNNIIGGLEFFANRMIQGFTLPLGILNAIPGVKNVIPDIPRVRLPRLHQGGIVPGAAGQEVMTLLQAGERVTPRGDAGGGTTVIQLVLDGKVVTEVVHDGLLTKQRLGSELGFAA